MIPTTEIITTSQGRFSIDTHRDAKMAGVLMAGKHHQEDTLELLQGFLTQDSVVVDAGAHIGTIAIPLARHAKTVIAYEPDGESFARLTKNAALNAVHIDARHKGLGASTSSGTLASIHAENAGAHTLTVGTGPVPIVALDEDVQACHVLKVDVEGMELAVLRGGERLIKEQCPVILFEVNITQLRAHHTSLYELQTFLTSRGYRCYLPFRFNNTLVLGCAPLLPLIALLMYPGAYLFRRSSSVFDILALPKECHTPFAIHSTLKTLAHVAFQNIENKKARLQNLQRKIFSFSRT